MSRATREAAATGLVALVRTMQTGTNSVAAAQLVMTGVSLNTISAQNITDLNAALAFLATTLASALSTYSSGLRSSDSDSP